MTIDDDSVEGEDIHKHTRNTAKVLQRIRKFVEKDGGKDLDDVRCRLFKNIPLFNHC